MVITPASAARSQPPRDGVEELGSVRAPHPAPARRARRPRAARDPEIVVRALAGQRRNRPPRSNERPEPRGSAPTATAPARPRHRGNSAPRAPGSPDSRAIADSSSSTRVLPIPGSPEISTTPPRPSSRVAQAVHEDGQSRTRVRRASIASAPRRAARRPGGAAQPRGAGAASSGTPAVPPASNRDEQRGIVGVVPEGTTSGRTAWASEASLTEHRPHPLEQLFFGDQPIGVLHQVGDPDRRRSLQRHRLVPRRSTKDSESRMNSPKR